MQNASIQRVVMTRKQSMQVFANPYGDYANYFLMQLNAAYRARLLINELYQSHALILERKEELDESISALDQTIKDGVDFLKQNEKARPWDFFPSVGYSYRDFSYNNWEGRYTNF